MQYNKKTWTNRETEYPNRYRMTSSNGNIADVSIVPNSGAITEAGEEFSASVMNDMETRIQTAFNAVNTDVAAINSSLQTKITAEENRARTAEAGLTTNLGILDAKVDNEIERATDAESALDTRIDAVETEAEALSTTIEEVSATADSALSTAQDTASNLIVESNRARQAESTLQSGIDTVQGNVDTVQGNVDTVSSNLAGEIQRATGVEGTLDSRVSNLETIATRAYKASGSIYFADLPQLSESRIGNVYNIKDDFVTTADFIEGAGKSYTAGTNVAIVQIEEVNYTEVEPVGDENPSEEGWYELVSDEYVLSEDTEVDSTKTYYVRTDFALYYDIQSGFIDTSDFVTNTDYGTTSSAGIVKPDGTTITVDNDGTIHGARQTETTYNVLDYGLVKDGTTDNSTAFANMLSEVPNGGVVYFPRGKYKFTSPIVIEKTALAIIGDTEMTHPIQSGVSTNIPMSILIYDGAANTTFLSGGSGNWYLTLNNLHFDCVNGFDVAKNSADFTELPYPFLTYTTTKAGINGVESTNSSGLDVSHCAFRGFSGVALKLGVHHIARDNTFNRCAIGIEAGYDTIIQNSYFNMCQLGVNMLPNNNSEYSFTNLNISDTWADQCETAIKMNAYSSRLLASNIWFSMFDKAAIICTGRLNNSKIDGSITRAGMMYAGIADADRTTSLAQSTDMIVADTILNTQINIGGEKRNIGEGKNSSGVCPSRMVTAISGVIESCDITNLSMDYADIIDDDMIQSFTHTSVRAKDNDGGGGSQITVDSTISSTSENPVQNKVIYAYIDTMITQAITSSY